MTGERAGIPDAIQALGPSADMATLGSTLDCFKVNFAIVAGVAGIVGLTAAGSRP